MQERFAADESAARAPVRLSHWVNEPYPPITEHLSAHEVARLTRRPRCVLWALALIGRFPRKARYRARAFGWRRSDVLEWMARDLVLQQDAVLPKTYSTAPRRQGDLLLQDRCPTSAAQGERQTRRSKS
jgi:predicted DNA-binding transcriptional regulator AlpA